MIADCKLKEKLRTQKKIKEDTEKIIHRFHRFTQIKDRKIQIEGRIVNR
jgi:hypothetical protein